MTLDFNVSNQSGVVRTVTKQFEFVVKNPCIDPNFVTVTAPLVNALTYIIDDPQATVDVHGSSMIQTVPITHTLCGIDIVFRATFDGSDATTTSQPLAYDSMS